MPTVPMTPTRRVVVTRIAARSPGSITPTTGTSTRARSGPSAAADALLQATTIIFTFRSSSRSAISSENFSTSSAGFGPYGNRPVSPK